MLLILDLRDKPKGDKTYFFACYLRKVYTFHHAPF
jgi:hypothetical protein